MPKGEKERLESQEADLITDRFDFGFWIVQAERELSMSYFGFWIENTQGIHGPERREN
jgi:hypothetical protein